MENKSPIDIIKRIRLYFEKTGKNLTVVAQEMGISPKSVSKLLSVKNPHRITNKTASRLCSVYPFNKNFLMYGEGELLVAETENSLYPDRTNWTVVDYFAAFSTLRYESSMFILQDYYLNLISSLSIFKYNDMNDITSQISSIISHECQYRPKGLDIDVDIDNYKDRMIQEFGLDTSCVFDRCNDLYEGCEEILKDFIERRNLATRILYKDVLTVKNNLPEYLSRLFEILLDQSKFTPI